MGAQKFIVTCGKWALMGQTWTDDRCEATMFDSEQQARAALNICRGHHRFEMRRAAEILPVSLLALRRWVG